jgi:hypothetical protein
MLQAARSGSGRAGFGNEERTPKKEGLMPEAVAGHTGRCHTKRGNEDRFMGAA